MNQIKQYTFLTTYILLFFGQNCLFGQSNGNALGVPTITNFSTAKLKGGPQNWAMAQDDRGILYFANSKGVLEFDGAEWRLTPIPNKAVARSLAIDENGRIYVGAQNEIGFLDVGKFGEVSYKSLKDELPEDAQEFGGVPNIHILNQGVFFHTVKRAYFWRTGDFDVLEPKTLFQLSFKANGEVYVNEAGIGLMRLSGGELRPVPRGDFFANMRIELILPYNESKLLISTESDGIFIADFNDVEPSFYPFETEASQFFKENPAYCGVKLANGNFALGTHQKGVIIIDKDGKPIHHLHEGNGLKSNLVWNIGTDQQDNLWLCLDDGVAHIALNSPFSRINTEGALLTMQVLDKEIYLGTTQGIFNAKWGMNSNALKGESTFNLMPNTQEQAWRFLTTDNGFLAAHVRGVFHISGQKATKITDDYTWTLAKVPSQPNLVIGGTSNQGLILLEKNEAGNWQKKHHIEGFEESSRYVAIEKQKYIWVSDPLRGVFRLTLSADLKKVERTETFGIKEGLPSQTYNFVYRIADEILFATEQGIFRFDEGIGGFRRHEQFIDLPKARKLAEGIDGQIWCWTGEKVALLSQNENGKYQPNYERFDKLSGMDIYNIFALDSQNVFFGTPNGLLQYNPSFFAQSEENTDFQAHLRKVSSLDNDSVFFAGHVNQNRALQNAPKRPVLELPYKLNGLHFEVAANWYEDVSDLQYQFFLEQFDKGWSAWSGKWEKDYTNLPENDYLLRVRAKNAFGQISYESTYKFTVLPPWYRTIWAYLLYISLIGLAIWQYTKRVQREQKRLEKLVEERTSEIRLQKEEIESQNEELASLNQEKNHLIGILAHDMRNPLHQIQGLTGLMKMKNSDMPEEDKSYITMIEGSVAHLNNMITKILDLEAIESKKTNVLLEKVDLRHMLRMMVDTFQGKAEQKDIELVPNIKDIPQFVMLDKGFGTQVFENLVSNAIKFSPKGKRIFISLVDQGGHYRAEVKDEGPGLKEEDMKKLFGKFEKLSARPTGGEKSTGLGLSIVKKYVEAMNGKVWCESEWLKGATFIVELEKVE